MQKLCQLKLGWDEKIPNNLKKDWVLWRNKLPKLENINVNRCYKPDNFGNVLNAEVHHFSDAREEGCGQCSYLRVIDEFDTIHCSLLRGKSSVSPIKYVSIPRLELTESEWAISVELQSPNEDDPEVRKEITVNVIGIKKHMLNTLEEKISCWVKMRRTLAYVKKYICRLRAKIKEKTLQITLIENTHVS